MKDLLGLLLALSTLVGFIGFSLLKAYFPAAFDFILVVVVVSLTPICSAAFFHWLWK